MTKPTRIIILLTALLAGTYIQQAKAQTLAAKTSLTMLATLTPNVELSYKVADHVTLHLPFLYNPWILKENSRFQQVTVQPGARYWTKRVYMGYFISSAALISRFHVGGWIDKKYRYDGKYFGLGIGGGYAWVLSNRLNLEAELMVGAVYADYRKCWWQRASRVFEEPKGLRIIPAKVDISLVYFIK